MTFGLALRRRREPEPGGGGGLMFLSLLAASGFAFGWLAQGALGVF